MTEDKEKKLKVLIKTVVNFELTEYEFINRILFYKKKASTNLFEEKIYWHHGKQIGRFKPAAFAFILCKTSRKLGKIAFCTVLLYPQMLKAVF